MQTCAGNNAVDGLGGTDTISSGSAWSAVPVDLSTTAAQVTGGSGTDTIRNVEGLTGTAFNDRLIGNGSANLLVGNAGKDTVSGGARPDTFVLNSLSGSDIISEFASGSDKVKVSQGGIRVGDGDSIIGGAVTKAGPGGFAATAELVVISANISSSITASSAAAKIGSVSASCSVAHASLCVVDNVVDSAVYLFKALDGDAAVEASELTLLSTMTLSGTLTTADFIFGA